LALCFFNFLTHFLVGLFVSHVSRVLHATNKGLEPRLFLCHSHQCICIYECSFFVGQWSRSFFLYLPSPFWMGAFSFYFISTCFGGFNNHGLVGSLKTI
jgi:hypothetical protein